MLDTTWTQMLGNRGVCDLTALEVLVNKWNMVAPRSTKFQYKQLIYNGLYILYIPSPTFSPTLFRCLQGCALYQLIPDRGKIIAQLAEQMTLHR